MDSRRSTRIRKRGIIRCRNGHKAQTFGIMQLTIRTNVQFLTPMAFLHFNPSSFPRSRSLQRSPLEVDSESNSLSNVSLCFEEPGLFGNEQAWLAEFNAYLEQNLSDPTLSIPGLADQFAMSESTLLRKVKRCTGLSPVQYLCEKRLQTAYHLLVHRQGKSIQKIAEAVGYSDSQSFSRRFKARFGQLPSRLI